VVVEYSAWLAPWGRVEFCKISVREDWRMSSTRDSRYAELGEMKWPEVKEAIANRAVAIIPVGSTEAHGPHLPLNTDVVISLEMARRAARKLAELGTQTVIAPPIAYSITEFSRDFPGTVSVSKETATSLVRDVGLSLGRQGFKTICIANSHLEPDHISMLREVAELVSRRTGAVVCFPDKTRRRWAKDLTKEFQSGACHAGQYESSLIMAADPDLVNDRKRQEFRLRRN